MTVLTRQAAEVRLQEARIFAAQGNLGRASSLLQALIHEIGNATELHDLKIEAYSGLVNILFTDGREAKLNKVFRAALAETGATPDARFDQLYLAGARITGTEPAPLRRRDRFLILVQLLESTRGVTGIVAECGCFRGLSSFLLCSRLREQDPAFNGAGYQIYDSFQGLSEPGAQDLESADEEQNRGVRQNMHAGKYAATLEQVRHALGAFPRIAYFPGWIPAAFPRPNTERYRFVHVDVDLYQPVIDSFEYFWPLLQPGGVMVCDDYNWPGAKRAVEEFGAHAGVAAEITPAQQAWFRKPA